MTGRGEGGGEERKHTSSFLVFLKLPSLSSKEMLDFERPLSCFYGDKQVIYSSSHDLSTNVKSLVPNQRALGSESQRVSIEDNLHPPLCYSPPSLLQPRGWHPLPFGSELGRQNGDRDRGGLYLAPF